MDVSSLNTNISHADGLFAFRHFLEGSDYHPVDAIVELPQFILKHNFFSFERNIYLQQHDTAIGSGRARQYANLFMAKLEKDFLVHSPSNPTCTSGISMTYS